MFLLSCRCFEYDCLSGYLTNQSHRVASTRDRPCHEPRGNMEVAVVVVVSVFIVVEVVVEEWLL